MAWLIVPVDNEPDQEIYVTVEVDGENIPLILRLRYNTEGDYWRMGIFDGNTGTALLDGIPFVTGDYPAANLLGQYGHLRIGSVFIITTTDAAAQGIPGLDDLGTDYVLLWGDNE